MNKEDVFALVIRHTCEVVPKLERYEFKPTDSLVELGANSMDRADILMMAMESLSLRIPRIELSGAKNIGELVDILYEKSQSG